MNWKQLAITLALVLVAAFAVAAFVGDEPDNFGDQIEEGVEELGDELDDAR